MLNQTLKFSLACAVLFTATLTKSQADEQVAPANTYNFSNTSPITFDDLSRQYAYPTAAGNTQISNAPVSADIPQNEPVVNAFSYQAAAFAPYRYIRADVALMFKNHDEIDAAAQQVVFDKSTTSIGVRAGVMLRRHFGVEGRLGLGLGSESKTSGGAVSEYKTNGYAGILGRGQTDLGNGIFPYANLGLMAVKSSFNSQSGGTFKEINKTTIGFAGAVGVEVNFNNNLVFGVEAAYLPTNLKTVSATVGYNF